MHGTEVQKIITSNNVYSLLTAKCGQLSELCWPLKYENMFFLTV